MARLTQRDFLALLACIRETYAMHDLDAFPTHINAAVAQLVPCDLIAYNWVHLLRRQMTMRSYPEGAEELTPDWELVFAQYMHEHPLITYYHQTHDGQALKISDFLTRTQYHRLGLYNEHYRRLEAEDQMAFTLPTPPSLIIGVALNRRQRNFSERDRLFLNLLSPHLAQACHNAEAVTQMQHELATSRQAMEALDLGVIVLGREGHVRLMTPRARQWVAAYFKGPARRAERLPEDLRRWVCHQEALLAAAADVPQPRQPLVVEQQGKRLVVRLLTEPEQSLLLLEEQMALQPTMFESYGLTRREAEVLYWVAEGKTDWETGVILGVSTRTVHKHVEHIFVKLGVETRTAAAAWVHRLAAQSR